MVDISFQGHRVGAQQGIEPPGIRLQLSFAKNSQQYPMNYVAQWGRKPNCWKMAVGKWCGKQGGKNSVTAKAYNYCIIFMSCFSLERTNDRRFVCRRASGTIDRGSTTVEYFIVCINLGCFGQELYE